jgi:MoaA/NifB/PqqE/SkfB family radical SAM enzyme
MSLDEWKRVIDEMAAHKVTWVLIRGGEPFLYPGVMELIEYLRAKGVPVSIDTNATLLNNYASDLVRIDGIELTVSVDGPEEIHDAVRGAKGSFRRIERGLQKLCELEREAGRTIPRSICFTISQFSYRGLGRMPDVARRLGIDTISIVPYYWVPESVGLEYEAELRNLGCDAFSWRGFLHQTSGIDPAEFQEHLRQFYDTLGSVKLFPFLDISEQECLKWFADATTPVGPTACWILDDLLDIQPGGEANFCVDFPDYSIGNVRTASIEELWNGERAERFREYRRKRPLAICHRCGAKYMSAPRTPAGAIIREMATTPAPAIRIRT